MQTLHFPENCAATRFVRALRQTAPGATIARRGSLVDTDATEAAIVAAERACRIMRTPEWVWRRALGLAVAAGVA